MGDQQIGRDTDQFPTDDQLDEIRGGDEDQHAAGEQGEGGKEPRVPDVALHVALGVDEHEESDDTDEEVHHDRQAVDDPAPLDGERPDLSHLDRTLVEDALLEIDPRQYRSVDGDERHPERRHAPPLEGRAFAEEDDQERHDEGHDHDEPCPLRERTAVAGVDFVSGLGTTGLLEEEGERGDDRGEKSQHQYLIAVQLVDVRGATVSEDHQHDRDPDPHLGGGEGDDEQRHHLAGV